MSLLDGKTALIFGIANERSIAWGIAKQLYGQGARIALSYASEQLERRVLALAEQVESDFVRRCDLSDDAEIAELFAQAEAELGRIDVLVHAVAYAPREALGGAFSATARDHFAVAMDISVYTLIAITRAALPLMGNDGSIMTVTYYGGEKVAPNYNVMGVAKAALESTVRYLAAELGERGIRVNAISAGPIRTLSAAGVSGFKQAYRDFPGHAPLRRNVAAEDVGNAAVWLAGDLSRNTTGDVLFVDAGANIMGVL